MIYIYKKKTFKTQKKNILTMAARGEPYIIMLRPAQMNPMASIRTSPCSASRAARIAAARTPTSKIPARMAVLFCTSSKTDT